MYWQDCEWLQYDPIASSFRVEGLLTEEHCVYRRFRVQGQFPGHYSATAYEVVENVCSSKEQSG